jgi:stage III sporulation protein AH
MIMRRYKKMLWLLFIVILAGATWWVIDGLDAEMQSMEIIPDDTLVLTVAGNDGDWGFDQSGAFFVEYRMQRERVRSREVEMLEDVLNNPGASEAARQEAEQLLFEIIRLMEQELLVENMVKAQGYEDAVFFYRNRVATVLIKQKELSEREFLQITESVAGLLGIEREALQVITRS